jgi:pyridoxamine 5'-phosphate oxidase family protein
MRTSTFTYAELLYLGSQRLGRLATVAPDGSLQNNPVGFRYNAELETIDIYGLNMGATRKYRNVRVNPRVALVVDDLASADPWRVRGVEIRGWAEALDGQMPGTPGMSGEVIRIHPMRIISWGLDPDEPAMTARDVARSGAGTQAGGAVGASSERVA